MEFGQPPSWRPDVDQYRAGAYRGTVRDALGGLRNLEQLLGSLRVGPRALSSILPDVRTSCPALANAIVGLIDLLGSRLPDARAIVTGLSASTQSRVDELTRAIESVARQSLNAKNRLRLEEAVSTVTRDIEAIVDLVDMLGEVAWGRTMSLDVSEVAREAYRAGEPPTAPQPAVRLTLSGENSSGEHLASPRALVLILHHLVRWSVSQAPGTVPVVTVRQGEEKRVEVLVEAGNPGGELCWVPGRRHLPLTESVLRCATNAMNLQLELRNESGESRLLFPSIHQAPA